MAADHPPPQPHPSRLTPFAGHPLVVGVVPGQPSLVALTAASLATATGASELYFAYVDTARYVDAEYPDGTVRHLAVDPDLADDSWIATEHALVDHVAGVLLGSDVAWRFRYLAGRPDRALTHLARAVDAAAFVVGTHIRSHRRLADFVDGSLHLQLAHRQHRPVLVVPLSVADWAGRAPWE